MAGSRFASIKKSVPEEFALGAEGASAGSAEEAAELALSSGFDVADKENTDDFPGAGFAPGAGLRKRGEEAPVGEVHVGVASGEGKSEWKERCPGLGLRWREIPVEHRVNAWEHLRDWVQWFVLTYEVPESSLPACWFAHPAAVEELWIAFNAEVKVWEEGNPSTLPLTGWATYVPGLLQRLKSIQSMSRCEKHEHIGPDEYVKGQHPLQRSVNERLWAEYVHGEEKTRALRPGKWRVSVVGNDGQMSAPREVAVPEKMTGDEVGLGSVYWQRNGAGDMEVRAHGYGDNAAGVLWESFDDATGEWVSDETDLDALPTRVDDLSDEAVDEALEAKLAELKEAGE